jgi:MFS family permease
MPPVRRRGVPGLAGLRTLGPSRDALLAVYLPAFILALGVGISLPALPLFTRSFDVDFGSASLVIVVFTLGSTLSTLPSGYLIDHIGARKVVLAGPIVVAVASLLTATAHSFPELLVYRFLEGCGTQLWVQGRLQVITIAGGSRRGTQITGMFGMEAAGRLFGPAIGGLMAESLGLRAPFLVYGGIALLAILPSFFLASESRPAAANAPATAAQAKVSWSSRSAWGAILTLPIMMLMLAQFTSFMTRGSLFGGTLDLYAVYAYGIGPQTVGWLAAVGGLLGLPLTFLAGRLMDRIGRRAVIVPAFCVIALSLLILAASAFGLWPFEAYVAAFLFSKVAASSTSGAMLVLGSDAAPSTAPGMYFGVLNLTRQLGILVSPAAFALIANSWGFGQGFVMLALMSLITALLTDQQLARGWRRRA